MSRYDVYGALGSPYSLKVRAALRAKRLPHTWTGMTAEDRGRVMPNVKAKVIPLIRTPDGSWTNDSTPFLLGLEGEGRALVPTDPRLRFVCLLIEDMADEWFMKAMFHYRWFYPEDAKWCANWLMFDSLPNAGREGVERNAEMIRSRQISRMALVGCTPETAPVIEASWKRTCKALEAMATGPTRFLFGDRISLADIALYGQLKVMSVDPTPMAWLREDTPYLYRWLDLADDASGLDGEWLEPGAAIATAPVKALLAQAGDTYLPFLQANANALAGGQESFEVTLEHQRYRQSVFKYQAKCLDTLRAGWNALGADDRAALRGPIGEGAGIL
ncbi:MAG: glutathione S-transferase C-terminal domain-containing protein [Hyphomonas sp.]|uniref:glutathione S-transferase C-terminal domain-containing protein n=1 Tax=Hyphomonas sp. TaxID=87 RepID=UPI0034A03EC3